MKRFIKHVAFAAIAVTMSMSAVAQQQGDKAVGGNLVIGTGDSYTNIGIGAKFLYNVTDPIRLAGEFDFFPKQKEMTWWGFSVYGHYLFSVADQVVLYPSVGLGVVGVSVPKVSIPGFGSYGGLSSDFAFSLGGGIDYALTSNLVLNGELRIKLFDGGNRINFAFGVAYKF